MKQVDAWKARLETILDNAVESVAQPGDLSRQTPALPDTLQASAASGGANGDVFRSVGQCIGSNLRLRCFREGPVRRSGG